MLISINTRALNILYVFQALSPCAVDVITRIERHNNNSENINLSRGNLMPEIMLQ